MAATRIKVRQFTDGVDGELITWDASGVPTTVAVGTSGHVLTSNGVGAAPTFQAVSDATTASNGLLKTGNDIALGGSLTANTTVTTTSSFTLNVATSRAGAANAGFIVTNNSTGSALKGVASGTGTGYGVWGTSADNFAIRGESTGIAAGAFFTIDANSNVLNGLIVDRQYSGGGSAAAGIGTSIDFKNETSTTISTLSNSLISKWTNATHVDRVSEFSITGVDNEIESTLLTLPGSGQLKLNKFGVGTFTGTAAYTLQVDSSGNIIEGTAGASGDVLIGGNSPGADMSIGTNNAFGLNLETNGTTRISMTSVGAINIGQGAAQKVTLSSTASSTSGGIELSSTSTTSGTDVGVQITGPAYTTTPTDNKVLKLTASYTRASGGGLVNMIGISPSINFTSTTTAAMTGIDISPTLTAMTSGSRFYGIYINANNASVRGIFQSGSSAMNIFEGKTAIGSATDPVDSLTVTGSTTTSGQFASGDYAITDGAGFNVNWNNGNTQYVTIAANRTPTFSNPKNGATYRLRIIQGGGGSKTITWPTVTWRGGTAPTLTTTNGKQDIIVFVYSNGVYYGDASLNY